MEQVQALWIHEVGQEDRLAVSQCVSDSDIGVIHLASCIFDQPLLNVFKLLLRESYECEQQPVLVGRIAASMAKCLADLPGSPPTILNHRIDSCRQHPSIAGPI